MERTPLRVTFYFLTQVTINVEHAVLWCKVDPKIALFIKQKKDKEKQNLKGPERKHPTALGPNKKLSITCNWKLKFLRQSLSFKTKTISCS